MEALTFKLDQFEFNGPMQLLLQLVDKNKIDIRDLPIALLCAQFLEVLDKMQKLDMDVTSDFLVMASDLMLIKSKMMLPQEEKEEEDPREDLAELMLRYREAQLAVPKLRKLFEAHSGRMVKDTDEISIDRTYVADQQISSLCLAIRRLASYQDSIREAKNVTFSPMISRPIVPVELKIVGILHRLKTEEDVSLGNLLNDAVSLPDMIAIFLGVLELIRMRQILIVDEPDEFTSLHGIGTRFVINDNPPPAEEELKETEVTEETEDHPTDESN